MREKPNLGNYGGDIWNQQEHHKHTNEVAYQGDAPTDYAVEPLSPPALAQLRNRIRGDELANYQGKIWTNQEHDLHSSAVEYQADSPSDYVVEPLAAAAALAQFRKRI